MRAAEVPTAGTKPVRRIEEDIRADGATEHVRYELSDAWTVMGVNGGYLAAVLLSAAERYRPGTVPVSVAVQFAARSVPGELDVESRCVRESPTATLLTLTGAQRGQPTVQAQVWLTSAGGPPVLPSTRAMTEPSPQDVVEVDERRRRGGLPVPELPLYDQVEERPVDWWDPAERSSDDPLPRRMRSWLRMAPAVEPGPWSVARRACVLLDAYPVLALVRSTPYETAGSVVSSLTLSVDLDEPADLDAEWWLGEFAVVGSGRGAVEGTGTLWAPDGTRIAAGSTRVITRVLRRERAR